MSDARTGLLADIVRNPADDVPRLILADWLEENGSEPRANVIRQMIAMPEWFDGDLVSSVPPRQPYGVLRAYEWLSLHSDREVEAQYGLPSEPDAGNHVWSRKHMGVAGWLHWSRGFVGAATLPWFRFRHSATRLFRTFPLERVSLNDLHPEVLERDESAAALVWCWNRTADTPESNWPDSNESSYLSPELFDLVVSSSPGDADEELYRSRGLLVYESESAAREALAGGALLLGRKWRDDPERSGEL